MEIRRYRGEADTHDLPEFSRKLCYGEHPIHPEYRSMERNVLCDP